MAKHKGQRDEQNKPRDVLKCFAEDSYCKEGATLPFQLVEWEISEKGGTRNKEPDNLISGESLVWKAYVAENKMKTAHFPDIHDSEDPRKSDAGDVHGCFAIFRDGVRARAPRQ